MTFGFEKQDFPDRGITEVFLYIRTVSPEFEFIVDGTYSIGVTIVDGGTEVAKDVQALLRDHKSIRDRIGFVLKVEITDACKETLEATKSFLQTFLPSGWDLTYEISSTEGGITTVKYDRLPGTELVTELLVKYHFAVSVKGLWKLQGTYGTLSVDPEILVPYFLGALLHRAGYGNVKEDAKNTFSREVRGREEDINGVLFKLCEGDFSGISDQVSKKWEGVKVIFGSSYVYFNMLVAKVFRDDVIRIGGVILRPQVVKVMEKLLDEGKIKEFLSFWIVFGTVYEEMRKYFEGLKNFLPLMEEIFSAGEGTKRRFR